jgi:hypothetical protein
LSQLRGNTFNLLNTMNIVLLSKQDMAETVGDFRPISLVHNIAKILSKILALRHAPRLPDLVSSNQSAFVKKRCIHDNFVLVQSIVKDLHRRKTLTYLSSSTSLRLLTPSDGHTFSKCLKIWDWEIDGEIGSL